ncbi:MAG TPA: AI-2E family transporter [Bacteroidales bacterium]
MGSSHEKKTPFFVNLAAIVIVIAGLIWASSIISTLLLALFISIICAHPINWLRKRKIPEWLALSIVLIAITSAFILLGGIIGNTVASFSKDLPVYEKSLKEIADNSITYLNTKGFNITEPEIEQFLNVSNIMNITVTLLSNLGEVMGNIVLIFFIAIFLLLEMDDFSFKFLAIKHGVGDSLRYLITISNNIRHYLSIMTLISFITALLIWGFLAILGVKYAILWALIAFLLNFIPNIGSIIAAIPAVLFALIQSGVGSAFWTIIGYIVINMVVGNIVAPKMLGKGLGLSTFIAFMSFIFWGYILGTVGMFLSVPLTMAIKIFLEQDEKTKWIAVLLGTSDEAKAYDKVNNIKTEENNK